MAHIGQELGLQDIGSIGGVAGIFQLAHRTLQVALAFAEVGQQVVEALGQALEQLIAGLNLDGCEVAAFGHVLHGLRQDLNRLDHPMRQAARQEQCDTDTAEQQHERQGDELRQHRRQSRARDHHTDLTQWLAVRDHRPGDRFGRAGHRDRRLEPCQQPAL